MEKNAGQQGLAHDLAGIGPQRAVDAYQDWPFRSVEPPVIGIVGDQRMPGELGDLGGRATAGEITGRGAEHAVVRRKPFGDEARILQVGDANREVEAFAHDIDEGVAQHEIDRHQRVGVEEALEMRRDMHPPEGGWRRDA